MMPIGNEERSGEIRGEFPSSETQNVNGQIPLNISTSKKGQLSDNDSQSRFQNIMRTLPSRLRILKFTSVGGLVSPSARFRRFSEERDEISRSVPSSNGQDFQERFKGVFTRKIDWASLWRTSEEWIRNPLNMALLLWMICVAVSGAILFLVMTGMLNGVLPKKSQRNEWFEVNNQIINALFTLMCLYQHPKRFHHLVLLCRWKQDDISQLRTIYCKNGTYKPHEWFHMMVVIVLLHVNCFAQYALCGLNLGYKRSERPAMGVAVCLVIAIAAPAVAGLYCILSPLGREYELKVDEEAADHILTVCSSQPSHLRAMSFERRLSFAPKFDQRIVESRPQWRGGLFDIWEDITLAYLSLFCTFCVFGWNMERLGFGNMYVHIATFLLFCMAPFWIFNLAAVNIDNDTVRAALGITGIVLGLLGLLYGGFWRIKMRKRFNLPANNSCCGKPALTDYAQWVCCCWCSLAQEVRTADYYDIVEDKFFRKQTDASVQSPLSPLSRENGLKKFRSGSSSPYRNSPRLSMLGTENLPGPSRFSKDHSNVDRELPGLERDEIMKPPVPSLVQREDYPNQKIEVLTTG